MYKIELGQTGEYISTIGLGTMYFGSKIDEQRSFELLDKYTKYGGSLFDSANKYASWIPGCKGGESEQLLGKWIKERANRQQIFVTSKVGFPYGEIPKSLKKEIIISECEKSLKRLDIETIDLYFAHSFDNETPIEESMEAFFLLKKEGKIRFAGASNFYSWQLQKANLAAKNQDWEGFSALQQRHTYLEPTLRVDFGTQVILTPEMEQFCNEEQTTIMAYSPLLGGAYSKSFSSLPIQYQHPLSVQMFSVLKNVADELQVSQNAVVLAWMMQNTPTIIPLISTSSIAQLEENLKVLSVTLSKNQLDQLNQNREQIVPVFS
ncbi:MAG: aldo/keto reductase [Bacteroidales bacterium]|nr:aldo/keto reductase [Bacteroidales bacterium]